MKRTAAIISFLLMLTACADRPLREDAMPTCSGEADCAAKWSAARVWVLSNFAVSSDIHVVGDSLIYSAPAGGWPVFGPSVKVVKDRIANSERYRLDLVITCEPLSICTSRSEELLASFNHQINAVAASP